MHFAYSNPVQLDPATWKELADKTGLTVDRIVLDVWGTIHRSEGKTVFRVHQTDQVFTVSSPVKGEASPPPESGVLWVQGELEGWKNGEEISLKILQFRL